ncbi:MAG: hypothetical protein EAZ44_11330 [Cytophagia bacterium]|nr:MAG: hypothetical protein EAZ44_11330 [Cytophagia bacterium]TAG41259.1 MAG: hypothetical protein EAZ31_07765 [Cytophagia bacterium]
MECINKYQPIGIQVLNLKFAKNYPIYWASNISNMSSSMEKLLTNEFVTELDRGLYKLYETTEKGKKYLNRISE